MRRIIFLGVLLWGLPATAIDRPTLRVHKVNPRPKTELEAVATRNWLGTINTDWSNVGNWSGGAIPVTGDTVRIDSTAINDLLVNVDRTGDGAGAGLNLVLLHIHNSCTVNVGSAANPLKMTADLVINDASQGEFHYTSQTGTANLITDRLIQRGTGVFGYTSVGGAGVGFITLLEILRGRGTVNLTSTTATAGFLILGRFPHAQVTLTGSSPITDFWMSGGELTYNMSGQQLAGSLLTSRFRLHGGQVDFRAGLIAAGSQDGGTFLHNSNQSAPIGQWDALGGTLDSTQTPGSKQINIYRYDPENHIRITDDQLTFYSPAPLVYGEIE